MPGAGSLAIGKELLLILSVPLGEKSLGFSVFYKLVMVLPKTRV